MFLKMNVGDLAHVNVWTIRFLEASADIKSVHVHVHFFFFFFKVHHGFYIFWFLSSSSRWLTTAILWMSFRRTSCGRRWRSCGGRCWGRAESTTARSSRRGWNCCTRRTRFVHIRADAKYEEILLRSSLKAPFIQHEHKWRFELAAFFRLISINRDAVLKNRRSGHTMVAWSSHCEINVGFQAWCHSWVLCETHVH